MCFEQPCSETSATKIVCILPRIPLPAQITSYLNGLDHGFDNSTHGGDYIPQAVNVLVARRYVDDGDGNTMSVYVGLIFDGNVKYRNLTDRLGSANGSIVLVPGPIIQVGVAPFIIDLAQEYSGIASLTVPVRMSHVAWRMSLVAFVCSRIGLYIFALQHQ